MNLVIKLLTADAKAPTRADPGCAGHDLYADEARTVPAWDRCLLGTGIAMELPEGTYGRIAPRSSLSLKRMDIGAGVLDSSYRGEIKVLMINSSSDDVQISKGDKIAQLIVETCHYPNVCIGELSHTTRGENGFGSTGS